MDGAAVHDTGALERFLRERDLLAGPIALQRIGEGHANLTYLVTDGERDVVLRRRPPPPIPPGGHDVLREAEVLHALQGGPVPVPALLAVERSGGVLGAPFLVMERVRGLVATTHTPAVLDTPAGRRAVADELVDVLATLHDIDPATVGLEDGPPPPADLGGHLRRFARILDGGGGATGELGELLDRLAGDPPEPAPATIVHGDYRLGNVMLAAEAPARIRAVLDWELAIVGDPLRDVGYFLATYADPGEPLHALTAVGGATLADGYPRRAELAERYAAASGGDLGRIAWYTAMAQWKLAVLFEHRGRPDLAAGLLTAARPVMGMGG